MASLIPMAMFGQEVPPGDVAIKAEGDIPAAFRITMAAIDPSALPEGEDGQPQRATLKVIRQPLGLDDDYDDDEDDEDDFDIDRMDALLADGEDDDEDDEDEDEDEDLTGGPSDLSKSKKARVEAAIRDLAEKEGMDIDEDEDDEDATPNGVNGVKSLKAKGKMPVSDDDDEDDDDDDLDSEDFMEEFVICTLDPQKNYQQPLDITIGEDERVFFKVSGTHAVYLTGNYVEPATGGAGMYDPDDDEDEDYDLEPDEDELDEDEEEDELDDLEDPRITELVDEEDEAPKLVDAVKKVGDKKGSNKRPAEDEPQTLDDMIKEAGASGEQKLSKKQLKKMKKNDGTATAVEEKATDPSSAKSDKKVQFAKNLEQGPTPTKEAKAAAEKAADSKDKSKGSLGVKTVQGVTIDDKKLGNGPAAKNGDRVGMRYIGKLEKDGKVFDSNKKGKPFSFKLGSGEVIKGWDIGIQGMTVGGERRITIPARLAYGSKGAGKDIPPNSTLVFDVKLLELNKTK